MNNKSKIIIACLALLLVISIGYALFSETINISGTATAKGSFDMQISSARVVTEKGSTGATAVPSPDGNSLVITIPKLEYPGAYVNIDYEISNNGTIDAIYKNYSITGETNNIEAEFVLDNLYYLKGETKNNHIKIFWKNNISVPTKETTTIVLEFGFEQIGDHTDLCNKTKQNFNSFLKLMNNNYDRIYDYNNDGLLDVIDKAGLLQLMPKDCK